MEKSLYICVGKLPEMVNIHTIIPHIAYPLVSSVYRWVVCQNISKGVRSLFVQ